MRHYIKATYTENNEVKTVNLVFQSDEQIQIYLDQEMEVNVQRWAMGNLEHADIEWEYDLETTKKVYLIQWKSDLKRRQAALEQEWQEFEKHWNESNN